MYKTHYVSKNNSTYFGIKKLDMKKVFIIKFLFFVFFVLSLQISHAQTVYVKEKGEKFHKKN